MRLRLRESDVTLVVALCVDAALRLLAGVELATGVRIAVVVQPARANLQTKSPRVMDELNKYRVEPPNVTRIWINRLFGQAEAVWQFLPFTDYV